MLCAGRGSWQVLGSRERDAGGSLFTRVLPTTQNTAPNGAAAAGREPDPPAPPAAKNNHGGVTLSGEMICLALRAGCCVLEMLLPPGQRLLIPRDERGKDQGMLSAGEKGWICFGHIPVRGINTPFLGRLAPQESTYVPATHPHWERLDSSP